MATASIVRPVCGQSARPLSGKVQTTLMGPLLTGPGVTPQIVMSEDGEHLAIVAPKGSRQVVLLDGVEGPVFDEIPSMVFGVQRIAVQFSPTGGHSGYLGRRGGDLIAVVDGKEAATVTKSQSGTVSGSMGWSFWFNRDGSHVAYSGHDGPQVFIAADGVSSPGYREIDATQTLLSGKRLAYVAQTGDQQWHAVVDGKAGPGYVSISTLTLTPDGDHYAYVAQPAGSPNPVVVSDGVVLGPTYRGVLDLEQAADGRVAYVAPTKGAPGAAKEGGVAMLMVGGAPVPGSCGTGQLPMCKSFGNPVVAAGSTAQRHIAWSPDGKGFAYIRSNDPSPGVTVVANGKPMGPTYTDASQLVWSAGGSRFAYLGIAPAGRFIVVDGEELPAVGDLKEFQFSPDGKRYGFVSYGPAGFSVVVDGKAQVTGQGYNPGSFRWSSDSKHFAYGIQSSISSYGPVVDGVAKPVLLANFFSLNPQYRPQLTFPPLVFSPDGNHLAYVAKKSDGTGKTIVVVDAANYAGPGQSYTLPSWSPDSKHFGTMITTGQGWTAMIDGMIGPYYEAILQDNAASCRFVDAHTFRFYGIKAGQIYRVTLDVS